ncbi:hypothetical protein BC826DRAFT_410656 [Russula brevipes]|nr:hypothetical protein BC826DRAFT_410656 [Russula brevipes]
MMSQFTIEVPSLDHFGTLTHVASVHHRLFHFPCYGSCSLMITRGPPARFPGIPRYHSQPYIWPVPVSGKRLFTDTLDYSISTNVTFDFHFIDMVGRLSYYGGVPVSERRETGVSLTAHTMGTAAIPWTCALTGLLLWNASVSMGASASTKTEAKILVSSSSA